MPTSVPTTLRRVRGCVAGGLSGGTSVVAHGLGGGDSPSTTSLALLVVACAAFGATASSVTVARGALLPLLAVIVTGQTVGHATLLVTAHHGHVGLGVTPTMLAFHALTAAIDVVLIRLAESAAVWAMSLLHRLVIVLGDSPQADAPMWVAVSPTIRAPHGLVLSATAVTRGPPPVLISH
ncbi:hypothetical protein HH308_14195 [Gordonia sp. TBRC 11910]|uniref:Uncharacterized protein n=1 Tax=Gordonia asplenii TaxID=2725283 RepID=A0A848KZW0_9ACTN|nr:hypothetical protein [Gordonia asplenii]NMO02365.1 hypothetical protein [Gordonia asplenii]